MASGVVLSSSGSFEHQDSVLFPLRPILVLLHPHAQREESNIVLIVIDMEDGEVRTFQDMLIIGI